MADQHRTMKMVLVITMVSVSLLATNYDADAEKASGTFSRDLPVMMEQAVRDVRIATPGEARAQAERVQTLLSTLQRVLDGDTFTVDTDDDYIGAIVRLVGGGMTRRPYGSLRDEVLFVRHYEKVQLLVRFRSLLLTGDVAQAVSMATTATERFPDYGPAWTSLGIANMSSANYGAAEVSFAVAKKLGVDPQTYHASVLLYITQGKTAEAQREAKAAAGIDPELKELSSDTLQYLRASRPVEWGAYRAQLSQTQTLSADVINRAFDAPTRGVTPQGSDMPSRLKELPSVESPPGQVHDIRSTRPLPTGPSERDIRPSK